MNEELRKAYQEKAEAQLKEWGGKIEELKNKADTMTADAKVKVLEKVEELKKKMQEGTQSLQELKSASADKWESFKSKIEGIGEGIKKAIEDMSLGS